MEGLVLALSWSGALALVVLSAWALRAWWRQGVRSRGILALAAVLLASQVILVRVALTLEISNWVIDAAAVGLFLGSGFALWVYADSFLTRWPTLTWTLGGLCAAAWVWAVVQRLPMQPQGPEFFAARPAASLAVLSMWIVTVVVPTVRMWRGSSGEPPLVRRRLRALVIAYAALTALVVSAVIGGSGSNSVVGLVLWIIGLVVFLPLMWVGFVPPEAIRRRWERAEEDAARSRLLLARIPAVMWTADADGCITSLGGGGLARLGWRPDELVGRPVVELLGHPDVVRQAFAGETVDVDTVQAGRSWSSRIEALTGIEGTRAGVVGLMIDVTERRAAEAVVRSAREELAKAQRLAHVGSWTWNVEEHEVTWSDEMYQIFGVGPDFEVTLEEFFALVHPEDRDRVVTFTQRALAEGAIFNVEYRIIRGPDEVRWVRGRGVPHPDVDGVIRRFQGSIQDITDHVIAQEALRHAYEREREAAERLRALDEMKNALLAAVSHELRTPLTVVLGMARTMLHPRIQNDPKAMLELAGRIEHNAVRLERLLLDLLDLDRLNHGVLEPRRSSVSIAETVRRVVDATDLGGHPVVVDVDDIVAFVDPAGIERIVENLVANAVKHTPRDTPIAVMARSRGDATLLSVTDEGPGVPDELKEAIFDPFRRGETYATGTGIGLSLVARFAEQHGGRAWVEDRPGGGAAFCVLVPNGADAELTVESRSSDAHARSA